jgi:Tfp pilus assembly protein PilE
MKNNKGFTVVELLVTFTLSMVLVIIMFQLIINLKDVYKVSGIKTELLNKQYLMENKIYKDLTEKIVTEISSCYDTDECVKFIFIDGTSTEIKKNEETKTISYNNYTIALNQETYFGNTLIETQSTSIQSDKKRILIVNIPIYNTNFKNENFGINIVFPYNIEDVTNRLD